ncbi:hypothetical protein [Kiloniella laminariae]|uniref:O-linked N-acetylglucosamine transferase family protein n=1 Tax=Kiloniella laminariae TaxID=454162 RepID=UPI0003823F48|nr:hypothetical protein [Kiloniella laminariae]
MQTSKYCLSYKYNQRKRLVDYNIQKWRGERIVIAQRWLNSGSPLILDEILAPKLSSSKLPGYWYRYKSYLLASLYPMTDEENKLIKTAVYNYKNTFKKEEKIKFLFVLSLFYYAHDLKFNFNIDVDVEFEVIPEVFVVQYIVYLINFPQMQFRETETGDVLYHYECVLSGILAFVQRTRNIVLKRDILRWCTTIYIGANMTDISLKKLYQLRGALIEEYVCACGEDLPALDCVFDENNCGVRREKIKVGLVISRVKPTAETSVWLSHFKYLDKNKFETYLYYVSLGQRGDDEFEDCFLSCFDVVREIGSDYVYAPNSEVERNKATTSAVRLIRSDSLDLLAFSSVPSNSFVGFENTLTPYRLAKKQFMVTAISPQTTGLRFTDVVISVPLVEPENAQEHFTEKVILGVGSNNCFSFFGRKQNTDSGVTRESLGISASQTVLINGSSMYKLSTKVLRIWFNVMRENANTVMVLFPYNPLWSNNYPMRVFEEHLMQLCLRAEVDPKRIFILPPRKHYYEVSSVLQVGDIYMDSFPFSGATSILDAFMAGLPTVVMRGKSQRAMQASAMHILIGLDVCVSYTGSEYKEKLVRLIKDKQWREYLSEKIIGIIASKPIFLNVEQFSLSFEQNLYKVLEYEPAKVCAGEIPSSG